VRGVVPTEELTGIAGARTRMIRAAPLQPTDGPTPGAQQRSVSAAAARLTVASLLTERRGARARRRPSSHRERDTGQTTSAARRPPRGWASAGSSPMKAACAAFGSVCRPSPHRSTRTRVSRRPSNHRGRPPRENFVMAERRREEVSSRRPAVVDDEHALTIVAIWSPSRSAWTTVGRNSAADGEEIAMAAGDRGGAGGALARRRAATGPATATASTSPTRCPSATPTTPSSPS
jgi:hypothetical protein